MSLASRKELLRSAITWQRKWRWYRRSSSPVTRMRTHYELLKRGSYARMPLHGEALTLLREGRLTVGKDTLLEPNVWLTAGPDGRIEIGSGSFLNLGVMVAASQLVRIGDHCMLANGCVVTDSDHRFDDLTRPMTWQGFTSKGPVVIGDNVWCGAGVVITSGVTIGERAVIGAGSVVTESVPAFSVAVGSPAKVVKRFG